MAAPFKEFNPVDDFLAFPDTLWCSQRWTREWIDTDVNYDHEEALYYTQHRSISYPSRKINRSSVHEGPIDTVTRERRPRFGYGWHEDQWYFNRVMRERFPLLFLPPVPE